MHLVVGLGNPGPKYARHRHNVGFMLVERLAQRWGAGAFRDKHKGLLSKVSVGGEDAVLLLPQTFMNLSGESVQAVMRFYKVPLERVLVAHDELDLPFATLRLKQGGGAAGHNGLRSIGRHGGGNGFVRLRVGIGRPPSGRPQGWVLSDFSASERATLPDVLERGADAVEAVIRDGLQPATKALHTKA